jgi:hypothetical protein
MAPLGFDDLGSGMVPVPYVGGGHDSVAEEPAVKRRFERYRGLLHQWITGVALGVTAGCAGQQLPIDLGPVGNERYLCCNMRFNLAHEASDANYERYREGDTRLMAGAKVRLVEVRGSTVTFQPVDGSSVTYTLVFEHGRANQSAQHYFEKILPTTDPMASMNTVRGDLAAKMREGRLVDGMTKAQTLLTRGYPPAHHTPSLDADEWIYYQTPLFVDRVHFVDDRIQSITTTPAP